MKLIIAGSRTLTPSFDFIISAIKMLGITNITEIVSGTASGVDNEGEHWASHMNVPVTRFPANWDKYGKAAGPMRNSQMANHADALLLIWDGKSAGSSSMRYLMHCQDKPIYEIVLKKEGVYEESY